MPNIYVVLGSSLQGSYEVEPLFAKLKITWSTLGTFYKLGWKELHKHFCESLYK